MKLMLTTKSIPYRQGHVEVSNVHDGCVNVEMWRVDPDVDAKLSLGGRLDYQGDEVTDNVELELSIAEAEQLAEGLLAAARIAADKLRRCTPV
ncbi:hypothetical protein ABFU84_00260 [Xanthomonas translucens pv. undulosa]|uniref:hypothetical protein n=1 Tax=Xanthomonas campestris pv. translucens TaxID=343 RepID=UPI003CF22535